MLQPDGEDQVDRLMRRLISRLGRSDRRRVPQVIGAIGVAPRVGVTTMSKSLAHVLSSDFNAPVCYLDLTGRRTKLVPETVVDFVDGLIGFDDFFEDIEEGTVSGAAVGDVDDSQWHALIRSRRFGRAIEQLRKRFDFIVLDLPPMLASGRTVAASQHLDGFVLVAAHGKSRLSDIEVALEDLSDVEEIGVVINRFRSRTPKFIRRWLRIR